MYGWEYTPDGYPKIPEPRGEAPATVPQKRTVKLPPKAAFVEYCKANGVTDPVKIEALWPEFDKDRRERFAAVKAAALERQRKIAQAQQRKRGAR